MYLENKNNRDASQKKHWEYQVGAGEDGQVELIEAVADTTHDSGQETQSPGH